ncbi:MAG: hypothetical protein EAZ62_07560 [Sphingobacteriia bacterium]|nr:MAG: hypothetical protein EAZ62_07560 [Sphingobacteriia bacterium]
MKKNLIGALVGGIILFMCQFASWTFMGLHWPAQGYTANQDSVLQYLSTHLEKEGGYFLPNVPAGSSAEVMEKSMAESMGKPWATIQYHRVNDTNMGLNMGRGLVTNILLAYLLIWILNQFAKNSFTITLTTSLAVGLLVYLNSAYTSHIWYQLFDIRAYLIDYVVMWGLTGVWLGWWQNRKSA